MTSKPKPTPSTVDFLFAENDRLTRALEAERLKIALLASYTDHLLRRPMRLLLKPTES